MIRSCFEHIFFADAAPCVAMFAALLAIMYFGFAISSGGGGPGFVDVSVRFASYAAMCRDLGRVLSEFLPNSTIRS